MFASRREAGSLLAEKLRGENLGKGIVLGIPRGGVVIAQQVAKRLSLPFSLLPVKKLTAPNNNELAIGAVGASEDSLVLNQDLVANLGIGRSYLKKEISLKKTVVKRRTRFLLRDNKPTIGNRKVIITDDGAATGATAVAAARQARAEGAKEVIVAMPVISRSALEWLLKEADRVIYLKSPEVFFSVSQFYQNFPQVADEEVKKILKQG